MHFNYSHYTVHFDQWPSFAKPHDMPESETAQSCKNILLAGILGHIQCRKLVSCDKGESPSLLLHLRFRNRNLPFMVSDNKTTAFDSEIIEQNCLEFGSK